MAGTASVVVCDVARAFRYHVDVAANSANPGKRCAFTSPCVFRSENSGASSNTIHRTLTSSFAVPGPVTSGEVGVLISSTSASGGEMTDMAERPKTNATTSANGDNKAIQLWITERRRKAVSNPAAMTAVKAASITHGPNDTDRAMTETTAHRPTKTKA